MGALIKLAKGRDLKVHMDGARFSNALASLDCTPAEMTWKAGVDVLSLGATKNGAMASEAIILFPSVTDRLPQLLANQKRAGLMLPKMRYISAQMEAWLKKHGFQTKTRVEVHGTKVVGADSITYARLVLDG